MSNSVVKLISAGEFPFCEREILRYMGIRGENYDDFEGAKEIKKTTREVFSEMKNAVSPMVCYLELPINFSEQDNAIKLGEISVKSEGLKRAMCGAEKAVVFGATLGIGADRVIAKYSAFPLKELCAHAVGTYLIEKVCDTFCEEIEKNVTPKSCGIRFSPGYGDLPLSFQNQVFSLLGLQKKIGLTLNGSLLMSPSKSVTAIFGVGENLKSIKTSCEMCKKADCEFRKTR